MHRSVRDQCARIIALLIILSLAVPWAVWADEVVVYEMDVEDPESGIPIDELDFGQVCLGDAVEATIRARIRRGGVDHFANKAEVQVAAITSGSPLSVTPNGTVMVTLQAGWAGAGDGTESTEFAQFGVMLQTEALGAYSGTVTVTAQGDGQGSTGPFTFIENVTVTANVIDCTPSDTTPPDIAPGVVGALGNNGWYTGDVTVTWTVTDDESDITSTTGCEKATIDYDTAGVTFTCSATSAGGTSSESVTLKRDATPPTITVVAAPAANSAGWNNTTVEVTFTCDDATSGVASCGPDQTLPLEGASQTVTGTAVDEAGNTATDTVTVSIDTTKPTISAAATTSPNAAGWYNNDVTVAFTCDDALSGVPAGACPSDQVLSDEGAAVSSTAQTVTDAAGNVSDPSNVVTVKIDKTAPSISPTIDGQLGENGWYIGDVTVSWVVTDTLSGVASWAGCDPTTISSDTGAATVTCSATDSAGNSADKSVTIKRDATPPTITGSRTPEANAYGWNNADVTVSFICTDATSGIAICPDPVTVSAEGAGQSVTGTAVDNAGNTASATVRDINIDKTDPTITANVAGVRGNDDWYVSRVIVTFDCNDGLSGIARCTDAVTLTDDGRDQSVTGTAVDKAGNSASATAAGIHIDRTAPSITIDTPADGAVYKLGEVAYADYACEDAMSGVASCEGPVANGAAIDTSSVGAKTFTVNAEDVAGNESSLTHTYTVVYNFGGILPPVKANGSSVFKLGSTVPVKFQLTDASGHYVATAVARLYMLKLTPAVIGLGEEAVSTSAATTGNLFRYDPAAEQYIFNLSTKPLSTGTWLIQVVLDDGTTHTVLIGLR